MQLWKSLVSQPFKGITTDGNVKDNLNQLTAPDEDHGAPSEEMVTAAERVLHVAGEAINLPLDAPEWRYWMNPEFYVFHYGVRLEECSEILESAIHDLLRASLSDSGYAKCVACMQVNEYLGQLVHGEQVLNKGSYNFVIFGIPSRTEPWGWQLHGHHLCVNVLLVGTQMVVSPVFMGAEPNTIDRSDGDSNQLVLFDTQERLGLQLMQTMSPDHQHQACVYTQLHDPAMPAWRFHRADQRQLGGAFQDNRVIPYEGILVAQLPTTQQELVMLILKEFLSYLPDRALVRRLDEIRGQWTETYIGWIGCWADDDAFYYKIQSPVVLVEFDHHTGVFLTNTEPEKFHIHTIVRTPNGNDYGFMYRKLRN